MSSFELKKYDRDQIELLKTTICKGSTDDEFKLFLHACQHTGLDPFVRQIYAVKRWDSQAKREAMVVQVGIDGYRLVAERTGRYAPGPEPTFAYDPQGALVSATAYVKKQTSDGTWHNVSATAFFSEYCQRTKDGNPMAMWRTMPHGQLAKCAEALCIRKCFPAELSGVYTKEEMEQADNTITAIDPPITQDQAKELEGLLFDDDEGKKMLLTWAKINAFEDAKVSQFATLLSACKRRASSKAEQEMKITDQSAEVKE